MGRPGRRLRNSDQVEASARGTLWRTFSDSNGICFPRRNSLRSVHVLSDRVANRERATRSGMLLSDHRSRDLDLSGLSDPLAHVSRSFSGSLCLAGLFSSLKKKGALFRQDSFRSRTPSHPLARLGAYPPKCSGRKTCAGELVVILRPNHSSLFVHLFPMNRLNQSMSPLPVPRPLAASPSVPT